MAEPLRMLISACLLGDRVRYDGGHKRDRFLVETMGRFVEWVPVCPEVECGLPTPREPMRLVGSPSSPRLVGSRSGADHTERMARWTRKRLRELAPLGLSGYICKKDSPSSGMGGVTVYGGAGPPSGTGAGLFTKAFMEAFPLVPVEEEGRLGDPDLRDAFIGKVFTLRRFRGGAARRRTLGGLVEFHTEHKLLLLAHGRQHYAELGRLVARGKELPRSELFERYRRLLLAALSAKPTPKKRSDVLLHMAGHLRRLLAPDETRELLQAVNDYREGRIPLAVPLTLFRRHVRRHGVPYLARQTFLNPDPVELLLRSHA